MEISETTKVKDTVVVNLTDDQVNALFKIRSRIMSGNVDRPGVSIGQIRFDFESGRWVLGIGWLDYELAVKVAAIVDPENEYNRQFIERDR